MPNICVVSLCGKSLTCTTYNNISVCSEGNRVKLTGSGQIKVEYNGIIKNLNLGNHEQVIITVNTFEEMDAKLESDSSTYLYLLGGFAFVAMLFVLKKKFR